MNIIEKLKNNQPPPELYHYTSQTGLLSILESDSLWATKIHYLNDTTEFELALNLAKHVLNDKIQRSKDAKEMEKIDCLLDNVDTIRSLNICVISLSQNRDLLSQWRAYSGGIGGFSVGFKSKNLIDTAFKQNFFLVKCIYDENEQKEVISSLIEDSLTEDYNTHPVCVDPDKPNTFVLLHTGGEFNQKLASLAPVIKNKSFYEESEWRLISERGLNSNLLSYRPGVSTLIPYYDFQLGAKSKYLGSITIGPNPHPELARDAALMLLSKYGVSQDIPLYDTEIPFRNW